jgi:hypothetical protein
MKNLGKTLIIFTLTAMVPLFAGIKATVDDTQVTVGDTVTYTVSVSGQNVQKPVLNELCGQKIQSTSQGTSMKMVGSKFTKEYTFSYTFTPLKDCTIDALTLKIDGNDETAEAIDIRVVPMTISKDSPFILEMHSEQQKVRVGEPFKVIITFKQRRGSNAVDSKFEAPQIKNFWLKEQAQSRRFEEGEYSVTHLSYILAAQKPGALSIDPAQIKIATRSASKDAWGQWLPKLKWRTYFSNGIEVDVEALPEGVELVGDFKIEAKADKNEIEPNQAVNVTLRVSGSGNFEDIESLKPLIPGVSVFDEKAEVSGYLEQGAYKGSWSQKLAFVADKSFTIPPVELRYFDPESETVKTIRTEPISVKVNGTEVLTEKPDLTIERPEEATETGADVQPFAKGTWEIPLAVGVAIGLLIAMVVMLIPWRRLKGSGKEDAVSLKDHKAVLMRLMAHRHDPEVAEMVTRLEANLYGGAHQEIDKRQLRTLMKRVEE